MNPFTVYLVLESSSALLYSLIFTVDLVYHVTIVQLSPLQLVLVGTILEVTIFLCEIPTGILADLKSRRLSIIGGYLIIGCAFIVEGTFPYFWTVAIAQVLWGLGYTFTSGATQAWVSDEIGKEEAGVAFLRGSQFAQAGALLAIPFSVWLGKMSVQLPVVVGGCLMIALAVFLLAAMTEDGFQPGPSESNRFRQMIATIKEAQAATRRQSLLLILLGIGLFYGLYSEGFDRLWTAHMLQNFSLPLSGFIDTVSWFGLLRGVMLALSMIATEIARQRVDTAQGFSIGRSLVVVATVIVMALVGFGLTRTFWVAITLYWVVGICRNLTEPLQTTWMNLTIDDPQVRATLFSVNSQMDAIGQIGGGPVVGVIGNISLRAALVTSALILSPVLPLYAVAIRRGKKIL